MTHEERTEMEREIVHTVPPDQAVLEGLEMYLRPKDRPFEPTPQHDDFVDGLELGHL